MDPSKINEKNKKPKISEDIPITYLWFGKKIPEDYLLSLKDVNYPVIFFKDAPLERNFTRPLLDIERADYFKLQFLYEYGGIYSDFDNTIDYPCLKKILEPYRNKDKVVFMADTRVLKDRQKSKTLQTHLIYAPQPKMPILRKILDGIDENSPQLWNFARGTALGDPKDHIQLNMNKCIKHAFDWSWFHDSNVVRKVRLRPKKQFKQKMMQKKRLIEKNENLQKSIDSQTVKIQNLKKQLQQKLKQKDQLVNELFQQLQKKHLYKDKMYKQKITELGVLFSDEKKQFMEHNVVQSALQQFVDYQVRDEIEQKQRAILQSRIEELQAEGFKLEDEREYGFRLLGGFVLLILMAVTMSLLYMKKRSKNILEQNLTSMWTEVGEQSANDLK